MPQRQVLEHPFLTDVEKELVASLIAGDSTNPHAVLGAHQLTYNGKTGLIIRAFHPDALSAELLFPGADKSKMKEIGRGLFAFFLSGQSFPIPVYSIRFHFKDNNMFTRVDPYQFMPTLGELDIYLASEGRHLKLYEKLGAHLREINGVGGVAFAVWAPNARRVSVIGEFNNWDGRLLPMRRMGSSGIWEIFVPDLKRGQLYKFELKTREGEMRIKTDPIAFAMELRPQTASVVWGDSDYVWGDSKWMQKRAKSNLRRSPMSIYEVHLGSWKREGERWLTYREIAPLLVEHLHAHGFNWIELLPITEHAYDPSWGYQVTGFFAPTSRFGTPDDLRFLIDTLHKNKIGVIMDWVPSHFPKDDFSLRRFDGTAVYEYEDSRLGEHQDWGTLVFNYSRYEVRNFLISSALFWLDKFHIDGLRVDAVASMLYLDYSRKQGEWLPNQYGGNENLEAISLLREFNIHVHAEFPGTFTVAEESTSFSGVTRPVHIGGLGFDFKWDMGWMNDTLRYFQKDPIHRKYHHNDLTFGMLYQYSENFILPLSHDEVAQGKGSLYDKMPGDHWQRLANLRLLYTYMFTHPGKKLLFMGAEFAQGSEWNFDHSLNWHECREVERASFEKFFKYLGQLYQRERALWARELEPQGFFWIDCNDTDTSVISYVRWGDGEEIIVVLNFTPVPRQGYRIGVPRPGHYVQILNSDSSIYGGSNLGDNVRVTTQPIPHHGHAQSLCLTLPPLAGLLFKIE